MVDSNMIPRINLNIKGTDGHTPIYQPDARWTTWGLHNVYMGEEGKNRFVPNVGDYVVDSEFDVLYKVVDVDPITFIPTLRNLTGDKSDKFINSSEEAYRIYYDKTQSPYTLTPEDMIRFYTPEATVYRIYRGKIGVGDKPRGEILSRVYNNSGEFIGHDVLLQDVQSNSHDMNGIKSLPGCSCNTELLNGEVCTIVVYDSRGKVVDKRYALIDITTYVTQAYAEQKYIVNIGLKSIFIDETDKTTINFPSNLPVGSFMPIGVVTYNDGTNYEEVVDGSNFTLLGMNNTSASNHNGRPIATSFAATTVGHRVPLTLQYKMGPDEATTMSVGYTRNLISKPFWLVVSKPNRSYAVKIFSYPKWVDDIEGYRLQHYLLNLDRDALYDITPYVTLAENSDPFYPKGYGYTQRLTIMVNLASFSTSFGDFIHSQTIDVVLRGRATDDYLGTLWEVNHDYPTETPYYGTGVKAKIVGRDYKGVNIANDLDDVEEFLELTYYRTEPLTNPDMETKPIRPTHLGIKYLDEMITIRVEDFTDTIKMSKELRLYDNIEVMFYKESVGKYLPLSVVNMVIRK